jgi:hypothetical protein
LIFYATTILAQKKAKEENRLKRLDQKNEFQGIVFRTHVKDYQDFVLLKSCSDLTAKHVLGKSTKIRRNGKVSERSALTFSV